MKRDPLLAEREKTHGNFAAKTGLIQNIKRLLRFEPGWELLTPSQQEVLDMIATKLGRIMLGNPNEIDHWKDIAGYAMLIVEEIEDQPYALSDAVAEDMRHR